MRTAVIVHERLGRWYRQLRPRLSGLPARWFETRSLGDVHEVVEGLAFPVALIDLARQPLDGLAALDLIHTRAPGARTLVLNSDAYVDASSIARELGAVHVCTGFASPPRVAELLARWIDSARRRIESVGWSRTSFPETGTDPWRWLSDYLGDPPPSPVDPPAVWRRSVTVRGTEP
jgi:hypothetical protein